MWTQYLRKMRARSRTKWMPVYRTVHMHNKTYKNNSSSSNKRNHNNEEQQIEKEAQKITNLQFQFISA